MHPTSEDRFKEIGIPRIFMHARLLEIGPDNVPSTYANHIATAGLSIDWRYASTETNSNVPDNDGRRIRMLDDYRYDCPDEHFDFVIHGQVLEHVRKPWVFIRETARVLKRGGKMIVICPATWPHHEPAPDCWRVYPEGIRALFEDVRLACEYAELFQYEDGTADTVAVGVKVET